MKVVESLLHECGTVPTTELTCLSGTGGRGTGGNPKTVTSAARRKLIKTLQLENIFIFEYPRPKSRMLKQSHDMSLDVDRNIGRVGLDGPDLAKVHPYLDKVKETLSFLNFRKTTNQTS